MKLSPLVIFLGLGFLGFVILVYALLVHQGKDTAGITTLLTTLIFPTLIGLLNLQRQQDTSQKLAQVEKQTNGALTKAQETIKEQAALLAVSVPVSELPHGVLMDRNDGPGDHRADD